MMNKCLDHEIKCAFANDACVHGCHRVCVFNFNYTYVAIGYTIQFVVLIVSPFFRCIRMVTMRTCAVCTYTPYIGG